MKKSKLITLSILSILTVGIGTGGVFAAWAVTDNANPFMARVTVGEADRANVKFMTYNGNVYAEEDVIVGEKLSSIPSNPTLTGYVFDGWSTNNTTYAKSSDNFATKTFSVDTIYYPRFASYGYKIGSGNAAHLENKWDINNNTSIGHGASLTLGTYIYGKTSLESATSAVTIPNAGGYALVCGDHESSWDSSKAGNLNNWSIQRYLTVTKTTDWNDLKLFARVNKSEGYEDKFLSEVSGNDYFVYADYDATSINFGAVANNVDTVPDNLGATTKYLDAITLDDTTSYTLPGTVYYLTGHFGDVD